ncbi:FtsK/SpoIIIE domain-containing protein [uncultured Corynebacterium sp.]|uniref:FtsK/SpoIIIE domain-containing protein n=1 Tax=uncultured Corynebacterium sp. TaxID=159447 RepID=UPI002597AFBB|nr:FtsK/SpoIIIE domain-containing protein [uncultured Corynebacterium sp.]
MSLMIAFKNAQVSIGHSLDRGPISVDLVSEAHFLITGQTRSGKSVFTYALLSQLALMPHVRVVGVDFSGILMRPFAQRIPDPQVVNGGDDAEKAVQMLTWLKSEMDRRNARLAETSLDKWSEFSPGFPLICCVLEEFPGTVARIKAADAGKKPADRLLPRWQALVASLMAEGAKAGIRLILIAQRPDAEIVGGAARENMPVRIAFKQSSGEAYRMLYPDIESAEIERVKMQPPGVGMFESPRLSRRIFKGPYVDYAAYVRHVRSCDLNYLRDLAVDRRFRLEVAEEWPEIGDPG